MPISKQISRSILVFKEIKEPGWRAGDRDDGPGWDFLPGPGTSIGNHSVIRVGSADDRPDEPIVIRQVAKTGDDDDSPDPFSDFLDLIL